MIENTKKPTVKDIAVKTGLAVGTISKYLNNGQVKKKNKIIIEEAIKELHYNVDVYARSMITKKTNSVGLIIPELGNTFYGQIASAIDYYLSENGYDMIVKETNHNYIKERDSVQWFIERRADAIICFSLGDENYEYYKNLEYHNIVFANNLIKDLKADFIIVNNYEIAKEGVSYLLDKGHINIAGLFINDSYTAKERERGYIDAFKEKNIPLDKKNIFHINETVDDAYFIIEKILKKNKFSAIFASNYISTLGSIFLFNEKGIKTPEEISIMGFDNIMLTSLYKPKLTIINQPLRQIAHETVNRVLKRIKMSNLENEIITLKCDLITGNTVYNLNKK